MNCQYCNKIFSTKSSLNNHQKTTKYCIKLQNKDIDLVKFQCYHCQKIFTTKYNLSVHSNKCIVKYEIEDKKDIEIKNLKEQIKKNNELNTQLKEQLENEKKEFKEKLEYRKKEFEEHLENQKKEFKEDYKYLQDKLERLANKAIERPTIVSNTTNNHLNIASFMDFNDIDKAKNIIENNLNINHVVDGQKGLARFVKDTFLTDDNGKLNYLCTDPSRHIFKYKDSEGEIKKDVEAKKLTDYILKGGIRTQSVVIGNEWCKDDDGDINIDKFGIMMEQQESIMKLSDDNSSFKKELASITTF